MDRPIRAGSASRRLTVSGLLALAALVAPEAGAKEVLLSGQATPILVVWSPDARRLAYGVEQEDDRYQMWVVNADRQPQAALVGEGAPVCWTHDARRVFAQRNLCDSPLRYQTIDPDTFATGPMLERPEGCLLWMQRLPTGSGYLTVTMHCPGDDVWAAPACDIALADDAGVVAEEALVTNVPASNTALPVPAALLTGSVTASSGTSPSGRQMIPLRSRHPRTSTGSSHESTT